VATESRRSLPLEENRPALTVPRPVTAFLGTESASGILLVVASVAALAWANSPWKESYSDLWHTELSIEIAGRTIAEDLAHWINDALMAIFFFVVGVEIKRELVTGELASARAAILPVVAAAGGMVVPAALYVAVNAGGDGTSGWGIPMATDIAFAVGVLALLGDRAPSGLKVLLLSMAIVDDVGAIVVIAIFYTDDVSLAWLATAGGGLVLVAVLQRSRMWFVPVYVVLGAGVWFATYESGVHATIAGVALGLLTPARPLLAQPDADLIAGTLSTDADVTADEVRAISYRIRESVPVAERLETLLHPWTALVVVPVFALANAGIEVSGSAVRDAATAPVTIGVVMGLVLGKFLGVGGAVWLAVRLRMSELPEGVTWRHVGGIAAVAGIGFTVSLFITGLAFDDPAAQDEAKLGVLAASTIAAVAGTLILRGARRPDDDDRGG
jgi:Na+:H+ antiporter, NhaA family